MSSPLFAYDRSKAGFLVLFILLEVLKTGFLNRGSGSRYREYVTCTGKGVNLF